MSEPPSDDDDASPSEDPARRASAAAVSSDYKVRGQEAVRDGTGVLGYNTATTGRSYGVEGRTDSADAGAAGLYGEAGPASGRTYGVHGVSNSAGGSFVNPAGVRGHAAAGEGSSADGVYGTTDGTGFFDNLFDVPVYAAGVRGDARATSGVAYTAGVYGSNNSTSGSGHGVIGRTNAVASEAAGVYGEATRASGATYGVKARTNTNGSNAAAFYADQRSSSGANGILVDMRGSVDASQNGLRVHTDEHTAEAVFAAQDSTTGTAPVGLFQTESTSASAVRAIGNGGGAIDADGYVDISDVGVAAYLSSDQTVQTSTTTTVAFDTLQDGRDDFGGLDTSTGVYTVQAPGDYHVDFQINWAGFFSEGDLIDYSLRVDGSTSPGIAADTAVGVASDPVRSFSKTLVGLSAGATLEVTVFQNSGGSVDIAGGSPASTYLTIVKVG